MFKKALSLLLSMMLVVTSLVATVVSVSAAGDSYFVSGSEELTGYKWAETEATCGDNVMTENGDGNYEKVFTNVAVGNGYQFKVVKNDTEWIGVGDTGNDNFTFNVTKECDVTVTYNPTTNEITATGEGVVIPKELVVDHITVVGNGEDAWLNGKDWKVDAEANYMTETSEGSKVYQIKFESLDAYENYQFKFAANGSWADNWGLPEQSAATIGEDFDLTFNGENMLLNTVSAGYPEDSLVDVTITLDLTKFDYPSRSGAKANIKIDGNRVPLLGDADGDYSITVVDATTIQKIAINLMSIAADDANAFKTCDANEDGRISIKDATIVQKYIVGGYETGNVGSPISVE